MHAKKLSALLIGLAAALQLNTSFAQQVSESEATQLLVKGCMHSTIGQTQEYINNKANAEAEKAAIAKALPLWKKLVESKPNNANYNFKLGLCYFYAQNQLVTALQYFRKATKDMTDKYILKNPAEDRAPYTALYFLGKCYLENNQPDSALLTLMKYQDSYLVDPINCQNELYASINLLANRNNPTIANRKTEALGSTINAGFNQTNPVVNRENTLLFFSAKKDANAAIFYSAKGADGTWGAPQPFEFNTLADQAPLFLAKDGKTLYIRRAVNGQNDIFYSKLEEGHWSPVLPLSEVNTAADENSIAFTDDGKFLYVTSNRDNIYHNFDIYGSELTASGKWSPLEKLPQPVNSNYNEEYVSVSRDGNTLFFSSDGFVSKGFGGYDLWFTHRSSNSIWSTPQNVGLPVNSNHDEKGYTFSDDNTRYIARINGEKGAEIWSITGSNDTSLNSMQLDLTQLSPNLVRSQLEMVKKDSLALTKPLKPEVAPVIKQTPLVQTAIQPVKQEVQPVAQKVETQSGEVLQTVYFASGEMQVSEQTKADLNKVVAFLKQHPEQKIQVVGHADAAGNWNNNISLSHQRSLAVRDYLIEKGIRAEQILYFGKGSAFPVQSNDTDAGKEKNRRVVVEILK